MSYLNCIYVNFSSISINFHKYSKYYDIISKLLSQENENKNLFKFNKDNNKMENIEH